MRHVDTEGIAENSSKSNKTAIGVREVWIERDRSFGHKEEAEALVALELV